jgi:D-serine deaminase-like pyridoxal phosphate-dependent protein
MKRSPSRRAAFPTLEPAEPPKQLSALETPAPIVDLDRLTHNLDRMASYCILHGLALRPHVKTHKSPRIAADQIRLGAVGLTCATPREVEVMGDVSHDLLLAYPIVGATKLARVMYVPHQVRLTVALDSAAALGQLAAATKVSQREVDVYVEIDLGMHRVGVQSPAVLQHPPLNYAGIAFYPGHVREHVKEQDAHLEQLRRDLGAYIGELDRAGVHPRVVSGGSTPTAWRMHEVPGVTEVRPGTYVYNDRTTAEIGACGWEDCALTVLSTVISRSVPGQAVIDAGSKALGREPMRGSPGEGFGVVMDHPDVVVARMSEEHGILGLSKTDWNPQVGDLVRIIPNHVCIVVHLNDVIYGVRDSIVETSWTVAARGRIETEASIES